MFMHLFELNVLLQCSCFAATLQSKFLHMKGCFPIKQVLVLITALCSFVKIHHDGYFFFLGVMNWTAGGNEPLSLCHVATSLHISTHLNTCAYLMGCTKVQQPMLKHYHKTEGIQIIGPLKLSYVNWAKLQRAWVAVAEPDADIITECRLLWKEKKALMNLPWLPVFSSITLIAHKKYMWQVAVNPFSSFSSSTCLSLSLSELELWYLQRFCLRLYSRPVSQRVFKVSPAAL